MNALVLSSSYFFTSPGVHETGIYASSSSPRLIARVQNYRALRDAANTGSSGSRSLARCSNSDG